MYGPAIILLHELGHALFARLGGYRVTHFSIGQGQVLVRLGQVRGAQIWVGRWVLSGGQCSAIPLGPVSQQRAWFHAGGLIVQGLLGGVLLVLPTAWWLERVALFNALVAVTNAIPWRFGGAASDGWRLLDLWRGGRRQIEILPQRRALLHALRHERQVGSPLGVAWMRLALTWGDAVAGAPPMDLDFVRNPPHILFTEPYLAALTRYVLVQTHRNAGDLDAAKHFLGDSPTDAAPAVRAVDALSRAGVAMDEQRYDAVHSAATDALHGPDLMHRQALVLLLHAAIQMGDDDIERATWRITRHVDRAWLDPVDAASALFEASTTLSVRGRAEAATGVLRAAETLRERTVASAHRDHLSHVRRRIASV